MASQPWVSFVDELPYQREGTPFNANGPREYTRKFLVVVKDMRATSAEVCFVDGIPLPYSSYISKDGDVHDLSALAINISASQPDATDWQRWIVTVQYSSEIPGGGAPQNFGQPNNNQGAANNPELEPPEVDWDFEVVRVAKSRDLDGKAYLNSARQPLTPAPMIEEAYPVLVYSRNELTFNRSKAAEYAFATNNDIFLGALPGQAQCLPPKAKMVFRGNLTYWRVTYRIRFKTLKIPNKPLGIGLIGDLIGEILNPDTWQPEFLDAGLCELQPIINKFLQVAGAVVPIPLMEPVPILKAGHPISQAVCLDGMGKQAQPDPKTGEITPVYLKFRSYKSMPFANLMIRGF